MYPSYYEMEWQTKLKLREALKKSRMEIQRKRSCQQRAAGRVETCEGLPQLHRSGTPC